MRIGTQIGRYEIGEKIGSGGMGEVYIARDTQLERDVAIKVLLPEIAGDLERVRRFKLEAKVVSALNHPNIITIHEIIEDGERIVIVYEYVTGATLREKISRNQLSVSGSIDIAIQIADAIAASHEAGIVHRDIKPENIMIRKDGYAKILDFGLAKRSSLFLESDENSPTVVQTLKGMILGSVSYMSPEQIRGEDAKETSDIWSLGVVLYEMLAGKNPFQCETAGDSIAAIMHLEPPSIGNILTNSPDKLQNIVDKALNKDADDRIRSMVDFSQALKDLRLNESGDVPGVSDPQPPLRPQTLELPKQHTYENPTLIQETRGHAPSALTQENRLRKMDRPALDQKGEMAVMDIDGLPFLVRMPRWMILSLKATLGLMALVIFLAVVGMIAAYFFIVQSPSDNVPLAIAVTGAPPGSTVVIDGVPMIFEVHDDVLIPISASAESLKIEITHPAYICKPNVIRVYDGVPNTDRIIPKCVARK